MNKLNIVFVTDGIFPYCVGGIQRHSRLLIEEFGKNPNLNIIVIHPHKNEKIFNSYKNISEIIIDDIDTTKFYLYECYKYSKRVYDLIKNIKTDIVYAQGLTVWHNIDFFKDNLIVNPHGLETFQPITLRDNLIGFPFRRIQQYIFNKASLVITEGGLLTSILKKSLAGNKIAYLPNAINLPLDTVKEKKNSTEHLQILFVARFAHNKGIHILLQAIKELNEEGYTDKIIFNLGGKGPLFSYYCENFKFDNLNYLGFVSDEKLIELYKSNDIFVLPTLFEGMPTVVLEAMSYSLPIIVSNVGATSELVDESNGFLIEKNNVLALKKAILSFYKLPIEEKIILSKNSFIKVENNFTWQKVAEKHIEIFENIKKK